MKKLYITILLSLISTFYCIAQDKKFNFETGLNYSFALRSQGSTESRMGIFINGIYNLDDKLNANMMVDLEGYTSYDSDKFTHKGRSMTIVPGINYNFISESKFKPYAGIGLGMSIDNVDTGVFNSGRKCRIVVTPTIGITMWKHLDVFTKYNISTKDFSRMVIGIGYRF